MDDTLSAALRAWYEANKRDLMWRRTRDPYRIWLSETILQQTRVRQGAAYYDRFLEAFPTVAELAAAPEDRVMKLWQGLDTTPGPETCTRRRGRSSSGSAGAFPPLMPTSAPCPA